MKRLVAWWRRWRRSLGRRVEQMNAPGKFLCDSCRYDYGAACHRSIRPNAVECPDYRRR